MRKPALYAVHTSEPDIPGPYIPTVGCPASVTDLFRIAGVVETGHEGENSCFTDVPTCIGLARVVEGEISGFQDLEAAEAALQVLFWHDRVDVLVPAFKVRRGSFTSYQRSGPDRTALAFDLFRDLGVYDQIFATEQVEVDPTDNNIILQSSSEESPLIGLTLDEGRKDYLGRSPVQATALANVPGWMGAPAYLTDNRLSDYLEGRGFFGVLYEKFSRDWQSAVSSIPTVDLTVPLPPLLSIVLDRAASRTTIPDAIRDLREELLPVRKEMQTLGEVVTGALTQREIEARCAAVEASFGAIFKASRAERGSVLLPLLRLYQGVVKNPLDTLISMINPGYLPADPKILARRTVSGRIFSNLLRTDSMHSLCHYFFSRSELSALHRTFRRGQPSGSRDA